MSSQISSRVLKAKAGRDSLWTLLTGAIASVLTVLTGVIVARTLGPAGKGVFSGAQLYYNTIVAVSGGVSGTLIYYLTNRRVTLNELMRSIVLIFIGLCVVIWSVLAIWVFIKGFTQVWWLFAAAVMPSVILSWQPGLFISFDRIRYLNLQNISVALLTLLGVSVSLLIVKAGISSALFVWMASLTAASAVVVGFAWRNLTTSREISSSVPVGAVLGFSARSSLTSILNFLNARVDSFVVITLTGATGFGLYSMATGFCELLFAMSQAVGTSLARAIGSSDFSSSSTITARTVRLNTIIAAIISLFLFVSAPSIIEIIYGKSFLRAVPPFRILLPALVIFSSSRIFNPFFAYQLGRPMFAVYLNVGVVVFQLLGCLVLIPRWGLSGAALASAIAYAAATAGQTWYFCKVTGIAARALWLPQKADIGYIIEVIRLTFKPQRA